MKAPEIISAVPSAVGLISATGGVPEEAAREILRSLIKAGFAVVPVEPTNSMFNAYIGALNQPSRNYETVVAHVGKARKRWKAMVKAGVAVAFSKQRAARPPRPTIERRPSPKAAGGHARAARLTPERRTEIARAAACARWGKTS